MKTIYIDIYFFINFCVDTLALAISAYILKVKCGIVRLSAAGAVGAMYAVIGILLSERKYMTAILSIPLFLAMLAIVTYKLSWKRKFKYAIAFFLSEIIIGGLVYYGFCLLDRALEYLNFESEGVENRSFLILSIIVLLSYAVVKLILLVLGNLNSMRQVRVCVGFSGQEHSFDALVDSGNLAEDPQDRRPVVFITQKLAEKIIGEKIELNEPYKIPERIKSRFRIIPIKSGGEGQILYGFLCDYVTVVKDKKYENIDVTFAIDTKGESYGGYQGLMPASALDNVF